MLNIFNEAVSASRRGDDRVVTRMDFDKLNNFLKSENWQIVFGSVNSDVTFNNFLELYQKHIINSNSVKILKSDTVKKIKPWITVGLVNSIKYSDKLKRQLIKNFNTELEHTYKNYRNTVKKLINTTKNEYYKHQFEKNKNNSKKIFQLIKEATDENSSKTKVNFSVIDANGSCFGSDIDMANYCNDFFINVGESMAEKIKKPNVPLRMKFQNLSSMFLCPIDESEVVTYINSLKNDSAPGIDGIDSKVIKCTHLYLLKPLVYIFNLIFKTGVVPSHFKTSVVTPILKSGNRNEITNYRPISLISNFGKILEKALKTRHNLGLLRVLVLVMRCTSWSLKLQIILTIIKRQ